MLQNIRQHTQGWIAWAIAIIISLTFALFGVSYYLQDRGAQTDVAKVNGEKIQQYQVDAAYEQLRRGLQAQFRGEFQITPSMENQLRSQAVAQTINTVILSQDALKSGLIISDDQVKVALHGIEAFQEDGAFSFSRFTQFLSQLRYTPQLFLSELKKAMLISQMQMGFVQTEFALPHDVDEAIKFLKQKRDIDYVTISSEKLKEKIEVTDDEITHFYDANQDRFRTEEQVSIEYIKLSVADLTSGFSFTDDEIKQFYEDNISSYTTPGKWHAAHILVRLPDGFDLNRENKAKEEANALFERLKAGESFSALANEYSDDIVSKKEGGDLGWVKETSFDEGFVKAVKTLKKPGEFSAPIRTKHGYHLIKLLELKEPAVKSFTEVKDEVSKRMVRSAAERQFADLSEQIVNLTFANPDSLEPAAKALNLKIESTELFSRRGLKKGIASDRKVTSVAFSDEVLQQKNNSDLIELDSETQAIIRVKEVKPSLVKPLLDVRKDIVNLIKERKAHQETELIAVKFLRKAKKQEKKLTPYDFAKEHKLSALSKSGLSRDDKIVSSEIIQAAFNFPVPDGKNTLMTGVQHSNGDYTILLVKEVHDGVLTKDETQQREKFEELIETDLGQFDYALYVQGLLDSAKIKDLSRGR